MSCLSQGSSIGTTTSNWLAQMMGAAEGYHPRKYFSKKQPTPPHHPQLKTSIPTKLPIKIVWPTLQEVDDSWGGQGVSSCAVRFKSGELTRAESSQHGGTIFFPSRVWNMSTFPRHLLYKAVSKKSRVTAHTKMSEFAGCLHERNADADLHGTRSRRRPQAHVELWIRLQARGMGLRGLA